MSASRTPVQALVAWRASTGYTRTEVGGLFGVARETVRGWERALWRVPERVQVRLRAEGWLPRRRYPQGPPRNHAPLCPPSRPCRSCSQRRRWTARRQRPVERCDSWTPEQDARLRALVGTASAARIAAQMTTEFGIPRTARAIWARGGRLGLSFMQVHYSRARVEWLLGLCHKTTRPWFRLGWLETVQDRPGGQHTITAEALERFLRAHAAVIDATRMPIVTRGPDRRWRDLVLQLNQRDPLYSVRWVAAQLGVDPMTACRWCREGRLGARRMPGRGGWGWRIPRSGLLAFRRPRPRGRPLRRAS